VCIFGRGSTHGCEKGLEIIIAKVLIATALLLLAGNQSCAQEPPVKETVQRTTVANAEIQTINVARADKEEDKSSDSASLAKPEKVAKQQASPEPTPSASELSSQLNNPAAPVTFIQFRNINLPNIPGTDGVTNSLQIQPVIPILPSKKIPFLQLIKITLPIAFAPSPIDRKGLGDLQFFDLISIKESWGRWGFGPALVFPTATSKALGAGKWQAGPSFALVYTKAENWTIGAVLQNPISFAGDSSRPAVNNLIITPTVTYNFPEYLVPGYWKHGWFAGLGDLNITFDWKNGGAGTIPLSAQLGRVFKLDGQPLSLSVEAGLLVKRPDNTRNPGLILGFEFSWIFKGHRKHQ
jgi:hypothetical protein